MKVLLKIPQKNQPEFIRKAMLAELIYATARGFETPAPKLARLSYDARLQTYAVFTKEQAERTLSAKVDAKYIKERLYQNTYALGRKLRVWLSIETIDEVMRIGKALYNMIGIEFDGNEQGAVSVKRCFFSLYYSSPVCGLISSLDEGLFSGLSGGRRLIFSQRITEGKECCKAKLFLQMTGE